MHPHKWMIALAALGLASCSVDLTGATCTADENCPSDQHCVNGLCALGARTGGDDGGDDGGANGADAGADGGESVPDGGIDAGCPAPGSAVGAGCALDGGQSCAGNVILTCNANSAGCAAWSAGTDCGGQSLVCGTLDAGVVACVCPPYAGPKFYVDRVDGSDAGALPLPTGAPTPAQCRFNALGSGLAVADAGSTVIATSDIPFWAPSTSYTRGQRVRPKDPGNYFRCAASGKSGPTEPSWYPDGGIPDGGLADGTAKWASGGDMLFDQEKFPLKVQAQRVLTGDTCTALVSGGSPSCPGDYAIVFNDSRASTPAAVSLTGDGAKFGGVAIANLGGNVNAAAILCNTTAQAQVVVDGVFALGAIPGSTAKLASALQITGNCSAKIDNFVAGLFSGAALEVGTTSAVAVALNNGILGASHLFGPMGKDLPNYRGLHVTNGKVRVSNASIAGNFDDGVLVEEGPGQQVSVDLYQTWLAVNQGNGVEVNGGSLVMTDGGVAYNAVHGIAVQKTELSGSAQIARDDIVGNLNDGVHVFGTGGTQMALSSCSIHENQQVGVFIDDQTLMTVSEALTGNNVYGNGAEGIDLAAPTQLTTFASNKVHANAGDQILIDADPSSGSWNLSGGSILSCPTTTANTIACYASGNYGLRFNGSQANGVNATDNIWDHATPSPSNGDINSFITVNAQTGCSAYSQPCFYPDGGAIP